MGLIILTKNDKKVYNIVKIKNTEENEMKKPEPIETLKSITVKNRKEAQQYVWKYFSKYPYPSEELSEKAGYTVYTALDDDSGSYMADLGTAYEINYEDGDDYAESFKIWFEPYELVSDALRETEAENKILREKLEAVKALIAEIETAIH